MSQTWWMRIFWCVVSQRYGDKGIDCGTGNRLAPCSCIHPGRDDWNTATGWSEGKQRSLMLKLLLWLILGARGALFKGFIILYPPKYKQIHTWREKAAVSLNAEGIQESYKEEALSDPQHRLSLFRLQWLLDVVHQRGFWLKIWLQLQTYFLEQRCVFLEPVFWDATDFASQNSRTMLYEARQWFNKKGLVIPLPFNNSLIAISWTALLPTDAASQYAVLPSRVNRSKCRQSVVTNISQGKKISRFDQSLNQLVSHSLSNAKMLLFALVILQRVQTWNYDKKVKNGYKIYQINSRREIGRNCNGWSKSQTNNNDLGINHFLQYTFVEVEETKRSLCARNGT